MYRIFWVVLLIGCSSEKKFSGKACHSDLPENFQYQQVGGELVSMNERKEAIASEQDRLKVAPLQMNRFLGQGPLGTYVYRPIVDPYPTSIVAVGEDLDIRTKGYRMYDPDDGNLTIYETSSGSGRYFIVDFVGGDGVGSNSSEDGGALWIADGAVLYGWHSWHSSQDNKLIALKQNRDDQDLGEWTLCGCPREIDGVEKLHQIQKIYQPIGAFELPGNRLPEILDEGQMIATYSRQVYKIEWATDLNACSQQ